MANKSFDDYISLAASAKCSSCPFQKECALTKYSIKVRILYCQRLASVRNVSQYTAIPDGPYVGPAVKRLILISLN